MSYTYTDYHHHQFEYPQPRFNHPHTQPLPDMEFPYRTAPPDSFHYAYNTATQLPQERILAAIAQSEMRWDNTDRHVNNWRPPPDPPPWEPPGQPPFHENSASDQPPLHLPSNWNPPFQTPDFAGPQWYPNVGYTNHQYGYQPPHGQNQYRKPPASPPNRLDLQKAYQPYSHPSDVGQQPYAWQQPPSLPSLPIIKPTSCWGPPRQREHFGPPQFDLHQSPPLPMHCPTCWDQPELRTPQGYPTYNKPIPHEYRAQQWYQACETTDEKCYEDGFTHIHSSKPEYNLDAYVCGKGHEVREHKGEDSYSSSFVAQVEYSYDTAGDFDCLSERRMVEEEHCDKLESVLSTDSRLAIEAMEAIGFDATNLDKENVSNIVIGLPNDNHDSEENRDGDRTMDDDNFINEIFVDPTHQYGSDNEHSPRHSSQAEEGDGDAEINDRNVASDDKAMVDYFAAALAGVSVTLDHSTSALVSIVDAVAALSCDALQADVSPFNLMDSGDGSMATDVVALAADFKVFFNSLKHLNSGMKLSDDSGVEILSLHDDFRDVSRSLHSRARVQLNSRFGVGSVKVLSMALGNLALSRLYLGINSIRSTDLLISNSISDVGLCSRFLEVVAAKRLLPALEELLRQAESSIKGRNEARELVELRTYEIAIEVSQVEAAISGLSEEVMKKSEEIESLKKSLLEKEGNVAELGRESMEKQEGMEGELSRLRLLISDYESKMEMQRPVLIDQLNYVTRLHEEMSKAMKIDEKRHEVFLDSRIFELNCLLASWFPP